MKKFIIGAMLAVGLVACANPTHADAKSNVKVMTKDEAATKIARLQKKAAFSKKNVKCTIRIKSSKKAFDRKLEQLEYLVAKKEWGVLATVWNRTSYKWGWDEPAYLIDTYCCYTSDKKRFKTLSFGERGAKRLETVKNNIATVTFIFKGSHHWAKTYFSSTYPYEMKIYNYLTEKTRGYSQVQKAAYTLSFLDHRMCWDGDYRKSDYGPKAIWEKRAVGACQHESNVVQKYLTMAGVKHVAMVEIPELNHMCNAVRFRDGRIYVCNLGSSNDQPNEYENGISEKDAWEYIQGDDESLRIGGEKIIIKWENNKTETYGSSLSKNSHYSKFKW